MAKQTTDAAEPAAIEALAAPIIGAANFIPNAAEGIQKIVDLTQAATDIKVLSLPTDGLGAGLPGEVPIVIDRRAGGKLSTLDDLIEKYRLLPERRTGTATATTLQSFIDLANRHKDDGSVVFARTAWPEPALTAVVDYHEIDGAPRWAMHRIRYAFPVTDEFKVWIDNNGKAMEQADFAAFLEEHAAELSAAYPPEQAEYENLFKEKFATPNDLIALSRSLEVFVGARVKRQERLSSGERTVEFVEEHTNPRGEKVDIPGLFMVSVPAFIDGEAVRIPARLRYRIQSGSIMWFYQLYRWQFWLRDQVKNDLDTVKQKTELPTFEGSPEA